jgi:hypothetical protein
LVPAIIVAQRLLEYEKPRAIQLVVPFLNKYLSYDFLSSNKLVYYLCCNGGIVKFSVSNGAFTYIKSWLSYDLHRDY